MMTVKQKAEESNSIMFAKEVIFGRYFSLREEKKKNPTEVNNLVHNRQHRDTAQTFPFIGHYIHWIRIC